jgi:hypothetical protein
MFDRMKISAFYVILKVIIFCIGIIVLGTSAGTCGDEIRKGGRGEEDMSTKTIGEVLKEHTPELMSTPGVVGTAQSLCDGQPCIKVFAVKKTPDLEQKIPDSLEGYPVVLEETGTFRALPRKQD